MQVCIIVVFAPLVFGVCHPDRDEVHFHLRSWSNGNAIGFQNIPSADRNSDRIDTPAVGQ